MSIFKRTNIVNFSTIRVTEDTNKALLSLISNAKKYNIVLDISSTARQGNPYSLTSQGREISIKYSNKNIHILTPEQKISAVWSLAIPLGFTPLNRYPIPGPEADVFHFFGEWQVLCDNLLSEGKGEYLWKSLMLTTSVDCGLYSGEKETEISIQSNIHRLGLNCGVIDGNIGDRTIRCLRSLGYSNLPFLDIAKDLIKRFPVSETITEQKKIKVYLSKDINISSSFVGKVQQKKTSSGFEYDISGNGKIILDIP